VDQHIQNFTARKSPADFARTDLPAPLAKFDANVESSASNIGRRGIGAVASMVNHPLKSLKGIWDTGKEVLSAQFLLKTVSRR